MILAEGIIGNLLRQSFVKSEAEIVLGFFFISANHLQAQCVALFLLPRGASSVPLPPPHMLWTLVPPSSTLSEAPLVQSSISI